MPTARVDSIGNVTAGQAGKAAYLDFLRSTNPGIDELLARNPGIKALLDRCDAIGAVAHGPVGNQVVTDHQWSVWSHSPRSGGLPPNWRDEVIIVFQTDTDPRHVIDLGQQKLQGMVVGVFSKGQVFTEDCVTEVPLMGFGGGTVEQGFADDFGFESVMKVRTVGADGAKAGVAFATGMVDAGGQAEGWWGWPGTYDYAANSFGFGGYAGRQYEFTHGVADHFPIDDHGEKTILKRVASPKAGEAPFTYEEYKPPRVQQSTSDAMDRSGKNPYSGGYAATSGGGATPASANNPLVTRIRNS